MAKKSFIRQQYTALVFFSLISLFSACATIGAGPKGGPKDKIPPKVLSMVPENLTRNFRSKKIVITFDEYFKLNEQAKQFSVSPDMIELPTLKVKGKSLEITFADSLEKNTTYTLNFGKGIVDVNEGNVLKNFSYVFSTGNDLDSLSVSGNIKDAQTGKPVVEAAAILIPLAKDSIWGKRKASIYALTDSSGNFKVNNLRAETYKVYALKEQSSDKIYQQGIDEVGFVKQPVVLKRDTQHVNMVLFKEEQPVFRVNDRKINNDGSIFLSFNQQLKNPQIKIADPANIDVDKFVKFSAQRDSVKIWLKELSFDSVKIEVLNAGKLLQTVKLNRGKKDTYTKTITAADNLEANLLNPNKPLKLTFSSPLESVDATKIKLTADSVEQTNFTLEKDSSDFLSYRFIYPWKSKSTYEIKFGAGAVTGLFNSKNKDFTKKFELAKSDDYGTLKVKIMVPEPDRQYILEVVNEGKILVNSLVVSKDTTVTFTKYRAGKYYIRIIYDTNKNGVWDTGSVKQGIQPEKIWNEPKELSIRANWDRNETITLPKEQ